MKRKLFLLKENQMPEYSYENGRLNLPFVGFCTFAKAPVCEDWKNIKADVAVLGVPNDMGSQYRSGSRFGPRAIREASTLFSFGHGGAYDHEDDRTYLTNEQVRMVDIGDVDVIHTDQTQSHANTEEAVRRILSAGAMPLILGGDHSITSPVLRAYDQNGPIHVVQIDAHLDFVDERHGVRYGHGNPMRRASEMSHVTGITQLGIRNVSSSNRKDYQAAIEAGSQFRSVRQFREMGTQRVLNKLIPAGKNYYVTIDIDGFDPSIAPGTGTPSHGGFLYYEILEFLAGLAEHGNVKGMDLVEVSPPHDQTGVTSILAAQILMNVVGRIFYK
jgi:agmatinase